MRMRCHAEYNTAHALTKHTFHENNLFYYFQITTYFIVFVYYAY